MASLCPECRSRALPRLFRRVRKVQDKLSPDVVQIRFQERNDWAGDPALFFRVVLRDVVARNKYARLAETTRRVEDEIRTLTDRLAYFSYRTQSENEKLKDQGW